MRRISILGVVLLLVGIQITASDIAKDWRSGILEIVPLTSP